MYSPQGTSMSVPEELKNNYLKKGWTTSSPSSPTQNTSTSTPTKTTSTLQFKSGLSDKQKTQLQNRLDAIKGGSPITQTDIDNFNYGLGSSWKSYLPSDKQVIQKQETSQNQETSQQTSQITDNLPEEVKQSTSYNSLTEDQKSLVGLAYTSMKASSEEEKAKSQLALDEAIKIADPYIKEQIRITQDEIQRAVGKIENDYESNRKQIEDRIKGLQEDLTFNREYLSLEQQSELANQLKTYKNNLYNLQQNAAESGLAFSSPRATAEDQLRTEQQGLAESTNRQYNKAVRDLQLGTERDTKTLQQNVSDLERQKKENLTNIQRQGEATLGSDKSGVSGITPLGGLTGTMDMKKAEFVTNWVNTLNQTQLNIK